MELGLSDGLRGRPNLPSAGGGSVVLGRAGATWLDFHAWSGTPGYQFNSERTMRIAALLWATPGATPLEVHEVRPRGDDSPAFQP